MYEYDVEEREHKEHNAKRDEDAGNQCGGEDGERIVVAVYGQIADADDKEQHAHAEEEHVDEVEDELGFAKRLGAIGRLDLVAAVVAAAHHGILIALCVVAGRFLVQVETRMPRRVHVDHSTNEMQRQQQSSRNVQVLLKM